MYRKRPFATQRPGRHGVSYPVPDFLSRKRRANEPPKLIGARSRFDRREPVEAGCELHRARATDSRGEVVSKETAPADPATHRYTSRRFPIFTTSTHNARSSMLAITR